MILAQLPQNKKLPVGRGRPEVPLFADDAPKEAEEDFLRRARLFIERYYKEDTVNPRLNYVFTPEYCLSKTEVWACIYLYYTYEDIMNNNDSAFVKKIQTTFGVKVISDRSSINAKTKSLRNQGVLCDSEDMEMEWEKYPAKKNSHDTYMFVVELWKSL